MGLSKKRMAIILSTLVLLIFVSCKTTGYIQTDSNEGHCKYFESAAFPAKGVVVVAHGLNTKPSIMGNEQARGTLVRMFLDEGYDVYRVTLPGHEGSVEQMRHIRADDWLDSARAQYLEAANFAYKKNVPLYLAAFSLGALVYENLIHSDDSVQFAAIVLFAPAIGIKGIARAGVCFADIFLADRAIIGSRAPKEYRAQRGVSISAYKALFELEDRLFAEKLLNCDIPTLVFIDTGDELISISKLKKFVADNDFSNWIIETVSNRGARVKPKYHHLIIDTQCVSEQTWEFIHGKIIDFLTYF